MDNINLGEIEDLGLDPVFGHHEVIGEVPENLQKLFVQLHRMKSLDTEMKRELEGEDSIRACEKLNRRIYLQYRIHQFLSSLFKMSINHEFDLWEEEDGCMIREGWKLVRLEQTSPFGGLAATLAKVLSSCSPTGCRLTKIE